MVKVDIDGVSTARLLIAFNRAVERAGSSESFHSEFQEQLRALVCEDALLAMRAKGTVCVAGVATDGEYRWSLAA